MTISAINWKTSGKGVAEAFARLLGPVLLLVITLWGAAIRLHDLGTPGLWFDEILGAIHVGPEHGPLYYALVRAAQAFGDSEVALRTPFAAAGVLSIGLAYLAGSCAGGPSAGVLSALFLASSPIHVYYSREARPYALLVLGTLIGLIALIKLSKFHRSRGYELLLLASVLLLLLTSSNGLFCAAALLSGLAMTVTAGWQLSMRRLGVLALGSLVALGLLLTLYPIATAKGPFPVGAPLLTSEFFARMANALVGAHNELQPVGGALYFGLGLTIFGVVVQLRTRTRTALALLAVTLVGFGAPIAALWASDHWINARYVLPALPALAVLASVGVAGLIQVLSTASWMPSILTLVGPPVLAAVLGGVVANYQIDAIRRGLGDKADWRHLARVIKERARPGDLVLTSNDWTKVCLEYYLPRVKAPVRLQSAGESVERAKTIVGDVGGAFLATGGGHYTQAIREWMDGFYPLFSARPEGMRLYYYPDRQSYLEHNIPIRHVRQDETYLWLTLAGRLALDTNSSRFLVDGWGDPESDRGGAFRWVQGPRAVLYIPVDRVPLAALSFQIAPYGPIARQQKMVVSFNGTPLLSAAVGPGWTEHALDLMRAPQRYGANIIEFRFAVSGSPSSFGGEDPRVLSCAFRAFVLTAVGDDNRHRSEGEAR